MQKVGERVATSTLVGVLLVGLYYLAYRYPFRINASGTSPTYADTPVWLQVGKYVIIAAILVAAVVLVARSRGWGDTAFLRSRPVLVVGAMAVFATVKGLLFTSQNMLVVAFVIVVGLVLLWLFHVDRPDLEPVRRVLLVFAGVAVAVELLQVILFATVGRLPALGYEGSLSVRFGSLLDDPNTYAFLIILLLPVVVLSGLPAPVRIVGVVALLVNLLLTQSATGMGSAVAAFTIGGAALAWKSRARLVAIGGAVLASVIVGAAAWSSPAFQALLAFPPIERALDGKAGSVDAHLESFAELFTLPPAAYFGFAEVSPLPESSYVALIANFGIPFTLAYIGVGVFAVVRLHRTLMARNGSPVHYGLFFYMIAFLIGSVNLQLEGVFPANFLFWVGVAVSMSRVRPIT